MKTVIIETSWHKATDKVAMTAAQYKFLRDLCIQKGVEMPFNSMSNALRSLTKFAASEAIDALKAGDTIEFN